MNIQGSDHGIFVTRTPASSPDEFHNDSSSPRRSSLRQSLQRAAEKATPTSSTTAFDIQDAVLERVETSRCIKKASSASSSTLSSQSRPKRAASGKKTKKDVAGSAKIPSPRSPTIRKKWSFRSSTTSKQRKRYTNNDYGTKGDLGDGIDHDDSHAGRIASPVRLFDMLADTEARGQASIVSWLSHGRAIRVHDPEAFVTQILPHYFRQSKITSFQRQLNVYGFRRIVFGRDVGAYHHQCFLRGVRHLAFQITRVGIKNTGVRSTYLFEEEEPDFYSMPPIDASALATLNESNVEGSIGQAVAVSPSESPLLDVAPPPLHSSDKPLLERLVDMQLDVGDGDDSEGNTGDDAEPMEPARHKPTVDGCTCCSLPSSNEDGARKPVRCCGCQRTHSEGDRIYFEGESFYYIDSVLHDSD